jgi:hypothetical protein
MWILLFKGKEYVRLIAMLRDGNRIGYCNDDTNEITQRNTENHTVTQSYTRIFSLWFPVSA